MDMKYKFDLKMYRTIASNIKKYREIKGLSIDELCEMAEIRKEFLINFENDVGDLTISIYDLYKISATLEVSIEKFFNKND